MTASLGPNLMRAIVAGRSAAQRPPPADASHCAYIRDGVKDMETPLKISFHQMPASPAHGHHTQ
jgi:hypothetical protein